MTTSTTTLQVTFVSASAAYQNTLGWYNSVTGMGGIIFADATTLTTGATATFTVNTSDLANIQFFLIPNGATDNKSDPDDLTGAVKVIQLSDGSWAVADVDSHGNVITEHGQADLLDGTGANALFTQTSKNAGGVDYASDVAGTNQTAATLAGDTADGATGTLAWEDTAATQNRNGTYSKPGDADYNDAVFNVSIYHAPPVAKNDANTVSEDAGTTTLNVLANDSDPNAGATFKVTSANTSGLHGTVTIAANGQSITYNPGSAFQYLAVGEKATETFTYTITDSFGGTSTATETVTITGVNDAPVVASANAAATVTEIADNATGENTATHAASGSISFNDADLSDTHTVSATPVGSGYLGTFTATLADDSNNGSSGYGWYGDGDDDDDDNNSPSPGTVTWSYSVKDSALDYLSAGQTLTQNYNVTISDGHGGTTTQVVTITLAGTNDAPTISSAVTTGAVTELPDGSPGENVTTLTSSGTISFNDVDLADVHSTSVTAGGSGYVGTLTAAVTDDSTGDGAGTVTWTFSVLDGAIDFLSAGQRLTQTYTVAINDGHGGTVSKNITITITGAADATNHAPVAVVDIASVTEDVTLAASGNVLTNDTDADASDTHSVTAVNGSAGNVGTVVNGTYGTLKLNSDGSYTYTLANGQTNVQALAQGQTVSDIFTYTNSDNHGGTSSTNLTVNVTGTNDAAVIGDPTVHDVTEDTALVAGNLTATGTISISDVDQGQSSFQTTVTAAAGNLGGLSLAANGSYTYTVANSAVQYLGASDTKTDSFTVKALDGTSKSVSFTIHGQNDAAVIGDPTVHDVTEDTALVAGNLTATGTISISDVDQGQSSFQTTVTAAAGNLGGLSLAANGSYTYTVANSAVQYLGASDTKVDTFTVTSFDGATKNISFTIHGANDAAVIGDPDPSATIVAGNWGNQSVSVFTSDGSGGFNPETTYVTGGPKPFVAIGDVTGDGIADIVTANDGLDSSGSSVSVLAGDGHGGYRLPITVMTGNTTEKSVSLGDVNGDGVLDIVDANSTTNSADVITKDGNGGFQLLGIFPTGGSVPYSSALGDVTGDGILDLVTANDHSNDVSVLAGDGHGGFAAPMTFSVNAQVPVDIALADVNGDGHLDIVTSNQVTDNFSVLLNNGSGGFLPAVTTALGNVVVNTPSLALGDVNGDGFIDVVAADSYYGAISVFLGDGHGNFTKTGTFDAFQGPTPTDIKLGDVNGDGNLDVVTANYQSNNVSVLLGDGHGGFGNAITLIGVDTPWSVAIQPGSQISVTEDRNVNAAGNLTASGILPISDIDQNQSSFQTTVIPSNGDLGSLTLQANGSYTYTVANGAVQYLGVGDTKVDTFTVKALDGTTKSVNFTIHGTNDAPTITGGITSGSVKEDTVLAASGQLSSADVDNGATATWSVDPAAPSPLGTFSVDANSGVWAYTLNNNSPNVQGLAAGQSVQEVYFVRVTDDHGASSSQAVTITISGTNDGPTITGGITSGSVKEDTVLAASGQLSSADVDSGATATWSVDPAAPSPLGTFSVDANSGVWAYTLNNNSPNVQGLAAGQSVQEVYFVRVTDQFGASSSQAVTITISGTNDTPTITGGITSGSVKEDTVLAASGQLSSADVDNGATATWSVDPAAPSPLGTFSVDANSGVWAYTLNNNSPNVQGLAAGQSVQEVYFVRVTDQFGASSSQAVTITISGTNDGPVAVADTNAGDAVVEAGVAVGGNTAFAGDPLAAGNVLANDSDIDATDVLTVAGVAAGSSAGPVSGNVGTAVVGTYGTLTLGTNGAWSYALTNADPDTNALAQGEAATDVFSYTVSDGHGGLSTTTMSVAITGTNDKPVIQGSSTTTGGVTEDLVTTQVTGKINVLDPDHNATQTWTVNGGAPNSAVNYHFRMDSFNVTKGTSVVLQDDFSDGLPPPNSPPLNPNSTSPTPTTYAGVGSFTESGGKLFLDSNNAASFVGVGNPDPVIGQDAIVRTNIDPSNIGAGDLGLKVDDPFSVTGRFDLILPNSPREEYGIRLTDRLVGGTGTPPDQPGTQTVALTVTENQAGVLLVSLKNVNFATDTLTFIQSLVLNPPVGADQIQLHLNHAANVQVVTASFDYLQAGVVIATQAFSTSAPIFTAENWTRAEIVADAPAFNDTLIGGSYGTLDVGQSGAWTYTLNNSLAATQALAQGQTATDTFNVQVADQYGATSTTAITVTVTGSDDAPIMQTASASRSLVEDSNVNSNGNLTASGLAQFSDVDLIDTHSLSATLQSTTTSGGALVSPGLGAALSTAVTETLTDPSTGDGHGAYQWNFAVADSAVQYLGVGQSITATYQVKVTNSSPSHAATTQTVTITISGANDAPIALPDTNSTPVVEAGIANPDTPFLGSPSAGGNVLINDSDPDSSDAVSLSVSGLAAGVVNTPLSGNINLAVTGTYGALTISPNGVWGYQLDNSDPDTNALAQGQVVSDVFTYTVIDGHGGTSNQTVTVNITGTDDAPTISTPLKLEVLESSGTHQLDLLTNGVDPEGNSFQVANVHWLEVPASLPPGTTVNADGHTISIDTSNAAFSLPIGATFDVNVGYDLVDSLGAVSHQSATVRLVGTDGVVPVGDEFRVNTYTTSDQDSPTVAALTGGGFVISWNSQGQDGDQNGVYAQRYNADGTPAGGEFQVNTVTQNYQESPSVIGLANGGFVISWLSQDEDSHVAVNGSARGVYERVYDANGVATSGEILVNTFVNGPQELPSLAALADGTFVNTWSSYGQDGSVGGEPWSVYGQHYAADGSRIGGEFHVNTYTPDDQSLVSTTGLAGGGFVSTWASNGEDGSGWGVYGQLYDANANRIGGEFRVNTATAGDQIYPTVASLTNGGFVVTWTGQDGNGDGIFGQRYDSAGAAVGGEFQINTYTAGDQRSQSVTGLDDGGFVVEWTSSGEDGDGLGVYGRRYDANGVAAGGEFRISESTAGDQIVGGEVDKPALDQITNGDLVASWYGAPSVSGTEAYARIFQVEPETLPLTVNNGFTFDLNGAHSGPVHFEGPTGTLLIDNPQSFTATITGAGSVILNGAGTLDFSGANTYTGGTTIRSGTLEIGSAGSAGSGAITFAGTGTLKVDAVSVTFANTIAGLTVSDTLDLAGMTAATTTASTGSGSYNSVTNLTTLTVHDTTGNKTDTFKLSGDYSTASWSVATDGAGGVKVIDPSPTDPLAVPDGGTAEIGSVAATAVTFTGTSGLLQLDASQSFTGTVSGFGGQDQIDLADIALSANATLGYLANADNSGGTLTVSDGVHSANIALFGQYTAASFATASDGHGGTVITNPPIPDQTQFTQPHA